MKSSRYGIITERDCDTMDAIIDMVCLAFPEGPIKTVELGVHMGHTSRGIHKRVVHLRGRQHEHIGVDNQRDMPIVKPFEGCKLLLGDSVVASSMIDDNSQHFVFVDADHSFDGTIIDFWSYNTKLVVGGYLVFHDTSPYIPAFKDYQSGPKDNPSSYISCRSAVEHLGLNDSEAWSLVFDEYDSASDTGGIMCFKKCL